MNAAREWPAILGFSTGATITESLIEKRYRKLARKYHPDAGGSNEDMTQLNLAKQLALDWVKREREKVAALQVIARQQERAINQAQQINAAMQQQMSNMYSSLQGQMSGGLGAQNRYAAQNAQRIHQGTKPPAYVEYTPTPSPAKWWQFWKR